MADLTQKDLKEVTSSLEEIIAQDEKTKDIFDMIIKLLALPDEQFSILAPGVLESYKLTLNNPNDKIALVQSMNAEGLKAEDLTSSFVQVVDEIDNSNLPVVKRDFLKELIATLVNAVNDTEGIAKRNVPVAIELCHPEARIPQYAHISDSGADVYALEDITVHPGETVLVPTGFKVALLPGFELQVRPKSGRVLKTKLRIANTPGTIDQGYRDEVKIIIENVEPPIKDIQYEEVINVETGKVDHLKIKSILYGSDFFIGKGEKFCQLVLCEVPKASFYRVESVQNIGEDRNGGFGSTGLQ